MAVVESQEECKIGKSQFLSYNLSLLLTTCFSLKRSDEGDFLLYSIPLIPKYASTYSMYLIISLLLQHVKYNTHPHIVDSHKTAVAGLAGKCIQARK